MLSFVGIVLIVVFSIQIYKAARDNGRNAVIWTIAAIFTSLFFMIGVPLCVGVAIGIYLLLNGADPSNIEMPFGLGVVIEIAMFAITIIALVNILKQASKLKEDQFMPEPPPPNFSGFGQGS